MALDSKTPVDLEADLASLEISDFLDETQLSNAEEIANVMAASCTTCECCCSISTELTPEQPVGTRTTLGL
jgi:thiazolylpeptide-type bacteriocin precursor